MLTASSLATRAVQAYTQHAVTANRELHAVAEGWAERNKVRWRPLRVPCGDGGLRPLFRRRRVPTTMGGSAGPRFLGLLGCKARCLRALTTHIPQARPTDP